MRNIDGWPADTDVLEPIYRVTHGGANREVNRLSVKRTLPSSWHAQVVGVGGLTAATGSITWASRSDVAAAHATAFNRTNNWPPRTRDRVDIYTGYRTTSGDKLSRQIVAAISGSSGDPMSETQSGVVDLIARMSRKVTLPPLLAQMPPVAESGVSRWIGLNPVFFTDAAARVSGFFSTPPMSAGCVLSAPLMGSAWPERGTVMASAGFGTKVAPAWSTAPWGGVAASDAYITYATTGGSALNRPVEITSMSRINEGDTNITTVRVNWGEVSISLIRTAGGASASVSGDDTPCRISTTTQGPVTVRVVPSGGNLAITIRDQDGLEATATVAATVAGEITSVNVSSTDFGALIGGVLVAFPSTAWTAVNYTRTAYLGAPAYNVSLTASPPIIKVQARDLLEEQATAELSALWIDGDGNLRYVNRDQLVSGPSVATLTSKDHLRSLSWEEDFTGVSSMVEVTGRKVGAINRSNYPRVEVWRSNYGDVEADGTEVFEELLHPGADEDWIMVDTSFDNDAVDNRDRRGSHVTVYYFLENGTAGQDGYQSVEGLGAYAYSSLQFVDHRTYKLTTTVVDADTTGWEKAEFSLKIPSTPQSNTGLTAKPWPPGWGGMNFPAIRAFGKVMWEDVSYTATAGVWDAPVLNHDVGWWVQHPTACQNIADLLAAQTITPRPYLNGVSITPDARLERGDIVTLSDPDVTGIEFKCLVVGIEDTYTSSPIKWSQTCDFRVLDYFTVNPTLAELDAAWAGELLTALDAARANETLTQFDTDPLKGAPQ